jgi:hypothetical protein
MTRLCIIHKWDNDERVWDNKRKCKVCGKVQQYRLTGSEGDFGWVTVRGKKCK